VIAFERGRSVLQLTTDVVIVVPEVTCVGLSDGVGRRVGDGAGEAEQVPAELLIVEVGGCCWRRPGYVRRRCGGGCSSYERRKRTEMRR